MLGVVWAGTVYWLNPSFLWWLLPVVGALMLSIPLSVYSSRASLGRWMRKGRFFMIPEESWPPREIRCTRKGIMHASTLPGFVEAVVDPITNALACASGVARLRQTGATRNERCRLVQHALAKGPDALTAREKMLLLNDPLALSRLHFQVWTSTEVAPFWRKACVS